jgi:hypothetical protein
MKGSLVVMGYGSEDGSEDGTVYGKGKKERGEA